ncbi:MAG: UDP-glucose 4-epimerase GalE [Alphaproteobacteria bacterium]|nr:UDP-glucose 4-epimerase GalE [Alphaproteobacteria bacterium]
MSEASRAAAERAGATSRGTVLVTGGAGYVGSHACKALAAAGYRPVAYDSLFRGHRWAVRWGPLEVGDITDRARLEAAMAAHRPVAVLHFAALAYVGESVADPGLYWRTNLGGTVAVLDAMRAQGTRAIVFSSSCTTYGMPDRVPIDEDHPQRPISPYGWSKFTAEQAIRDYGAAHGIGWAILRYFNAAGADPDGETGWDHDPETRLVPLALRATDPAFPLSVLGTDYPTPDGTCVRDFVHVSDLATAHVAALDRLLAGRASAAVNLGTGTGHSVRQVIAAAERVTGRPVHARTAPRRSGDPPSLVADVRRAGAVLDWLPEHSEIDRIVADAWRWMTEGLPRARQRR